MLAEQSHPSPHNHHLQEFLTSLKHERGFADATIVNRERSLKPFSAWLVAQGVPLSNVSPVVITSTSPMPWLAGGSGQLSRSMYSLCARFSVMRVVEVGAPRASLSPSTRLDFTLTKIFRKARRGKR
jgi:site-specific recombinase XerC